MVIASGCADDQAATGDGADSAEASQLANAASSDDEATDSTAGGDGSVEPESESEAGTGDGEGSDGQLQFGDPADYGYAPVGDEADTGAEPIETPTIERPEVAAPEVLIPAITEELAAAPETAETLDSIAIIDQSEPADAEDGQPRNSSGEAATLDDEASLACANTEIALGHFDEGRGSIAAERMAIAAQHAASSEQASVRDWAETLQSVGVEFDDDDAAAVVGFIAACAERGYEL